MNDKDEVIKEIEKEYKSISRYMRDSDSYYRGKADGLDIAAGILSRHPAPAEVEPLAVLADRKGCWIKSIINYAPDLPVKNEWYLTIGQEGEDIMGCPKEEIFCTSTYAAAEAKAREYLNGLPDKGRE